MSGGIIFLIAFVVATLVMRHRGRPIERQRRELTARGSGHVPTVLATPESDEPTVPRSHRQLTPGEE